MSDIIWQSQVTEDMVSHLNDNEISLLVDALNEVVAEVCENFEVE